MATHTAQSPAAERVVKRYDNRKLYDTHACAYVTLEQLERLIADGQEVRVLEQRTGDDITTVVLAQVILEAVRERTANIPRQVLTRLIRLSAHGAQAWDALGSKPPPAKRARDEAERIVAGLLRRGRLPLEEALALRQEITQSLHQMVSDTQRSLEATFHHLMEWTERERGVSPAIQALKERLLTLEAYLGERRPAARGRTPTAPKRDARRAARRA